jgi:hypothetical protein
MNGLIVTKPVKKVEVCETRTKEGGQNEPEIIDLQEYAKSRAAACSKYQ